MEPEISPKTRCPFTGIDNAEQEGAWTEQRLEDGSVRGHSWNGSGIAGENHYSYLREYDNVEGAFARVRELLEQHGGSPVGAYETYLQTLKDLTARVNNEKDPFGAKEANQAEPYANRVMRELTGLRNKALATPAMEVAF